jgi:predicted dehydrogenase
MHWDLWLGPAAARDYHSTYAPFRWRGWWDFGCGAIGDMAIHLADPAFWALDLRGPVTVNSEGPPPLADCGPTWMKTKFEFGQRGTLPPVTLHWYEGTAQPASEIARELPMNGSLYVGERGRIAIEHDKFPQLLPAEQFADFVPPPPQLPESVGHHQQWIEACKTGSRTGSSFAYAGPFTEYILLGNVAYRAGQAIQYDPSSMKITNVADANQWLTKSYRPGWDVA